MIGRLYIVKCVSFVLIRCVYVSDMSFGLFVVIYGMLFGYCVGFLYDDLIVMIGSGELVSVLVMVGLLKLVMMLLLLKCLILVSW